MHIPIPHNLRSILAFCVVMIIVFGILIRRNSGTKEEYTRVTAKVTYLSNRLDDLPNRDFGLYRYLKIENYPYPFEVYADTQAPTLDSLKNGDIVTVYFYETDDTHEEKINRFLQYVEKSNKMYFTQTDFQKKLGWYMIYALIIFASFCFYLYRKGKLDF